MTDTPATDAASSDELVFYTHPMSRGRMVRWLLEEIGQPYRTKVIDFGPPMKTETYLAINPMGRRYGMAARSLPKQARSALILPTRFPPPDSHRRPAAGRGVTTTGG